MSNRIKLWVAQGFNTGRFPIAPGTVGTLVGVLWTILLIASASPWIFGTGCILGVLLSIWLCGEAEKILSDHDPGSVVLDEIISVPLCCISWLVLISRKLGHWPDAEEAFGNTRWIFLVIIFILFRVFDILKPPLVFQSQRLPGGLGITIDDVLAAGYVNLVMLPVVWFTTREWTG